MKLLICWIAQGKSSGGFIGEIVACACSKVLSPQRDYKEISSMHLMPQIIRTQKSVQVCTVQCIELLLD
jgi:hypothetical protein